jgi:dTDP-4-dehydrorhamnose reductase
MIILITGANGQLGRCLQNASLQYKDAEFVFLGRQHLPIDNHVLTSEVLHALKPDIVINAAAYTAVDKAESEFEIAKNINGYAVGNMARVCKEINCRFLHISTDYVFDGNGKSPYKETDDTSPVNKYGMSKLFGEQLAVKELPTTIIIRTSWVYSEFGHNFLKTMLRLMKERDEVKVVNDQFGAPTNAHDLADAIFKITIERAWHSGVYHYANQGLISWFDFAGAIKNLFGLPAKVTPISTLQFPTAAARPGYSALNCEKIQHTFDIGIPGWKESLALLTSEFSF